VLIDGLDEPRKVDMGKWDEIFSAPFLGQIMTHLALLWVIHMLKVAAGGNASPLNALQVLIAKGSRCYSCYLFSSCLRYTLLG
jgi:hypothetical protein